MPDQAERAVGGIKGGLTKKVGPLPVYGWVLVTVGGGLAVYWLFLRPGTSAATTLPASGATPPNLAGGSGGGTGTNGEGSNISPTPAIPIPPNAPVAPTPPAPVAERLTNPAWLAKAIPAVAAQLGLDVARVTFYLTEYLTGGAPVGSTGATSDFQRVVQAAIQAVGQAPNPPGIPNPNSNFFSSNTTWWENARGFIGNAPGSVLQEVANLLNGQTTTISQAAADALAAARSVIGAEPTALRYTVVSAASAQNDTLLGQVRALWASATSLLNSGTTGTQLNNPAVYLPLYRASFPGLADEQIQAIQQAIKDLVASGAVNSSAPDYNVIAAAVGRVIQNGTRQAIPGPGASDSSGVIATPRATEAPAAPARTAEGYTVRTINGIAGYADNLGHFWSNGVWRDLTPDEQAARL